MAKKTSLMQPGTNALVRVPASTSNIGPGYDTLGMALNLYNDFVVRLLAEGPSTLECSGGCAGVEIEGNPFFRMYERVFALADVAAPPAAVQVEGAVPMGMGLGSSATATVAGGLAANYFLGAPFALAELFAEMVAIEGHPDNVTPSLFGGLTVTAMDEAGPLAHVYAPAKRWWIALLVPSYPCPTEKARKAMPKKITLVDAVANLSRLPLVIDALVDGDDEVLGRVLRDRWHESVREKKIKRSGRIRLAAMTAGATGTFISGAGPAIGAFCTSQQVARRVARAMKAEVKGAKFTAETLLLRPESSGAALAEAE